MIFKSDQGEGELNGFLDSGSKFQGELHFETSFRVDGKFSGKIVSNGSLIVGEGGEIDGETRVGQVFVSGTMRGEVHAHRRVQIAPDGKVFADISTPSLVVEDGAILEGHCTMTRGGSTLEPSKSKAERPVAKLIKPSG